MIYKPWPYQQYATDHIVNNSAAGLFMEMGLGKTVATLTALKELMHHRFEVRRTLVIAPLNVANDVWDTEISKWDHLKSITYSKILGSEKQRIQGLKKRADIYLVNRENVCWLQAYLGGAWPFDMLIVDESSSFKSHKSERFKALRMVRPLSERVVILTGTPAPNTLIDLWPQVYLLDQGERLGKTITEYRNKYFNPDKQNGHIVYSYKAKKETKGLIYNKIKDLCISMRASDYLTLPPKLLRTVQVNLSPKVKEAYRNFEKTAVLEMLSEMDGPEISAVNAAALCNKLVQFANGAVYSGTGNNRTWHNVHDYKLDALEEILDASAGNPVMVFYWFKHDLDRIKDRLARLKIKYRTLRKGEEGKTDIRDWNAKKVPVFLLHPASASHGLNLQAGGSIIVWFGLTWSLELYQQANARLYRQGQTAAVIIHHLTTKGTMDEDIMKAVARKDVGQSELMSAVRAVIKRAT